MMIVKDLRKNFGSGHQKIDVLKNINLSIKEGEKVALVGKSGSGKSTLLSLLSGLDTADSGEILFNGLDLLKLNPKKLTQFRSENFGIIFQQFHLFSTLTALENILLPLEILKVKDAFEKAHYFLDKVGLSTRRDHLPSQLSGGESQRVAIARALSIGPRMIFADEPSGNLDEETGETIMNLLFDLASQNKSTLLLVTHDLTLARRCDRQMRLEHGSLVE